jgi:hypothetical protein
MFYLITLTISDDEYKLYKKSWEELIAYSPLIGTDRIENEVSNNSSLPQERLYRAVT